MRPQFNSKSLFHQRLSSQSKKAHALAKRYYEQKDLEVREELKEVEEEIDKTVTGLYGITDEKLGEVKRMVGGFERRRCCAIVLYISVFITKSVVEMFQLQGCISEYDSDILLK